MKEIKTIIDSQYFPCIEYFSILKNRDEIWIETKERFEKQTYRNRCYILTSNKVLSLTVPIKSVIKKLPMDQIQIDYTQKWLNNHWRAMISAYNKSPFFEYYAQDIRDILFYKHERLLDLNQSILTYCLKVLDLDITLRFTDSFENAEKGQIQDMRSVIHPKKNYICDTIDSPLSYYQTFGNKFAANLSILDLISNTGPEAGKYF